jgi:hypothetical protein
VGLSSQLLTHKNYRYFFFFFLFEKPTAKHAFFRWWGEEFGRREKHFSFRELKDHVR